MGLIIEKTFNSFITHKTYYEGGATSISDGTFIFKWPAVMEIAWTQIIWSDCGWSDLPVWWSDSFKEVCREGIKKTFVQAALVRQFLSEGSINLLTWTFWSRILSPRDLEWQHHMVRGGTSNSGAAIFQVPCGAAIQGPSGQSSRPKFSRFGGLKIPLTKTNTTHNYYTKYDIWSI